MTRNELKYKVKVLLDEVTPYDNDADDGSVRQFVISGGDTDAAEINPYNKYIEDKLDEAAEYCLGNLPITLLQEDIEKDEVTANVVDGVGYIADWESYKRLVRVRDLSKTWKRDVTAFIADTDPLYLIMQNAYVRPCNNKPMVVVVPEDKSLELYSFPKKGEYDVDMTIQYIDTKVKAEDVKSKIHDYIALRCAAYVQEIVGANDSASTFMSEYNAKLNDVLK